MVALNENARVEALLAERLAARIEKDWARADEIRDVLVAAGVQLHDGKNPAWVAKANFDAAKLGV